MVRYSGWVDNLLSISTQSVEVIDDVSALHDPRELL